MTKIYWFSRHAITPAQWSELARVFGEDPAVSPQPDPLPPYAAEAVSEIRAISQDGVAVGVFPAHIAAEAALRGLQLYSFFGSRPSTGGEIPSILWTHACYRVGRDGHVSRDFPLPPLDEAK